MPTFAQIRACFAVGYFPDLFPKSPHVGTQGAKSAPIYRTHRTYRPSLRIVDGWFVLNMDVADVVAFFGLIRHAEFL